MDRIQGENYTTIDGKRQFQEGPPGTAVNADWLNQVQEEMMTCIQNAGLTPSSIDRTQLAQAIPILAAKYAVTTVSASASGFGTAYTCTATDSFIVVNGSGYAQITLPGLPSSMNGKVITIYNWSATRVTIRYGSAIGNKYLTRTYGQHMIQFIYYLNQWMNLDQAQRIMLKGLQHNTWIARTNAKNFGLNAVCYSENLGLWCAVGAADGVDAYILTSPDGITWTERANPVNITLNGVCWSRELGLFCAVGNSGSTGPDAYIVTSPDGIVWTERANPSNVNLNAVCWVSPEGLSSWGPGFFAAVGNSGSGGADSYIVISTNGVTWTEKTCPINVNLYGIAASYGGSAYMVGAATGVSGGAALIASGFNNFNDVSVRTTPLNFDLRGIAFGGAGGPVCVGAATGTGSYVTMGNGFLATSLTSPKNLQLNSICWDGDCYIAVGAIGATSGAFCVTSAGYLGAMIERPTPSNFQLNGVASDLQGTTVAVGAATGDAGYIITSIKL